MGFETRVHFTLNDLSQIIYSDNQKKGFWDDFEDTDTCLLSKHALIHSEISEASEAVRKPHKDEHCPQFNNHTIELADAIIRILDLCGACSIDIGGAVLAKLKYNKTRPYKHGKRC